MLETLLRPYIQPLADTVVRSTRAKRPILITGLSLLCGIACAVSITYTHTILAISLLWLSGFCDVLDGSSARYFNSTSIYGMYSDLIADRGVESAIALSLASAYPDLAWYTTLFVSSILLHFSTFMLAAFIFPNTGKKSIHYETSIIERSEAFIVITALLIFPEYRHILLGTLSYTIIVVACARFIRMYHMQNT